MHACAEQSELQVTYEQACVMMLCCDLLQACRILGSGVHVMVMRMHKRRLAAAGWLTAVTSILLR